MQRRDFIAAAALGATALASRAIAEPHLGDDGLYDQPFLLDSFLEMAPDHEDAAAEGKGLIVLFEQRGCPYCRELHTVNFERAEIVDYLTQHFNIVQLDLWGARMVVDFDGEEIEERDLAGKWFVNFTPTMVIFPQTTVGATTLREAEVFRMPGYFKPFHFISGLEYVAEGEFANQPFQRYLQDKFAALAAQGIDPDVW